MSVSELALQKLATPNGVFCMLALDHRDALRNAFRRAGVHDVSDETMLDLKCRVAQALAEHASAILLDEAAARRCRPQGAALLAPLEEQGHEPLDGGRLNTLLEGFGPEEARGLGADGCKLLLYFRADHPATAARQRELVARASEACHARGLPLVLEPLVYRLEEEDEERYRAEFAELVVEAAAQLSGSGADLLKVQFPAGGDEAGACARLHAAASPLPWALLGGSEVDAETFAGQLETACGAGASGFIAGRAIWGGALGLSEAEQERWLGAEAAPLFERLSAIAREHGRAWPRA